MAQTILECLEAQRDLAELAAKREHNLRDVAEGKVAALELERDALRLELAQERIYAPQLRALWAALEPRLHHCTRTGDFLVIYASNDEPIVSAGYELSDTWGTSDIILCDAGLLAQLIDALEKLALGADRRGA